MKALLLAFLLIPLGHADPVKVTCKPVPLHEADHKRKDIGPLHYLGGCHLTSPDKRFGGISALRHLGERRMLGLTDKGNWLKFTLELKNGQLVGVRDAEMEAVTEPLDKLGTPSFKDTESLALYRDLWAVGVENKYTVLFFDKSLNIASGSVPKLPFDLARLGHNEGIEAMTTLDDGRLLMMGEQPMRGEPLRPAWIVSDASPITMNLKTGLGFAPTEAETLANGDVLLLTRRANFIDGWGARLSIIPKASLVEGAVIEPRILAELAAPFTLDNMEAMAVIGSSAGVARVVIASDDNFEPFQRTLLMLFDVKQ